MRQLIFATNNANKIAEIRPLIGDRFQLITLEEAGIFTDIPEPFDTLEENAEQKSRTIHSMTSGNCFSEDTGLEVEALNGEPGVKSARYAGEGRDFSANIDKLLHNLSGITNRNARFRTVASLILDGKEFLFEGICTGKIIAERRGSNGFGYDPVFIPDGSDKTFAEMTLEEKNQFSHRKKAIAKLTEFLSRC
jgi:XTP/dITP diphosphohydrolase